MNFFKRNSQNIFLGILVLLNVLPWVAPLLLHFGLEWPAKAIYRIYSFFCHQIAWRSYHVADHQCAWCARDTAIWGAFTLVAFLIKFNKIHGLKWYWIFPFIIPIAMDGGIQTIATIFGYSGESPLYISTNFMRMITGALFGIGLGSVILPALFETDEETKKS